MYIAIEGIDTCGKSTQITYLQSHYPHAIFTKEPGGSALGEKIRELILFTPQKEALTLDSYAEFFLFLSDRAQHYKDVLEPHKNQLLISDRSLISSIAYAQDIPMQQSIAYNLCALRDYLPDLVVILELDKSHLQSRLAQKSQDSIESRGIAYMLEIQERMFTALKTLGLRYKSINASQSKESVCADICTAINTLLDDKDLQNL